MSDTTTFQPSDYAHQSIALHQLVLHAAKITTPGFVPNLLRVVCILELVSAVLYVISAIPTIRKEGFWLFKPEANGMIRPNTRILIPVCVVLYVAVDVTTLISLLMDLKSGTMVSVATGGIGLSTYPLLLCTGWTKIWNVLRAVPPTKYGLTAAVQANGELNLSYFRPRTINCLSAFFYGFPILFGGAPMYLITKEIWLMGKTFDEYNRNYLSIINGGVHGASIQLLNLEALKQLSSMVQRSKKVLLLAQLLSSGYLLYVVISFLFMMFGYLRILQAVKYQIKTFRESFEHRIPFAIANNQGLVLDTPSKTPSISVFSYHDTPSCHSRMQETRSWNSSRAIRFSDWLPTFRQTPEFLEKRQSPTSLHSHALDFQQWERTNRELIRYQLKALRKHRVNLIWQAFFNTLILVSFCGMNIIVSFNMLGVPTHYSLSNLTAFTIAWASISWVFTIGIPMGSVMIMVSFSSPITALRENTGRVEAEQAEE